LNHIRCNSCY